MVPSWLVEVLRYWVIFILSSGGFDLCDFWKTHKPLASSFLDLHN